MKAPDTIRIAITCADDSLALMTYVLREYGLDGTVRMSQANDDESIGAEIVRAVTSFDMEKLPIKGWRRMEEAEIPTDRMFRNAWRDKGKFVEIDMPSAREIHLVRVRSARAARLDELDREWMKATGQGKKADADAVEARRQRLRDLPAALLVDAAERPDELNTLWDDELGPRQDYA